MSFYIATNPSSRVAAGSGSADRPLRECRQALVVDEVQEFQRRTVGLVLTLLSDVAGEAVNQKRLAGHPSERRRCHQRSPKLKMANRFWKLAKTRGISQASSLPVSTTSS